MIYILIAAALMLLALPGLLHRWGRLIHPDDWSRWSLRSLLGGAVAAEAALLLMAAPSVLDAAGLHGLAAICARMAGAASLPAPSVAWLAAASAILGPAVALRCQRDAAAADREIMSAALLAPLRQIAGNDVRVLPVSRPIALSVASAAGLIVISEGLVATLSSLELAAVIRHERAHHVLRHHRYLRIAAVVESTLGVFPGARRSTVVLRTAVERAADEHAAAGHDDGRRQIRSALLSVVFANAPVSVAAFSSAQTVLERVKGLEGPAPDHNRRWMTSMPILGASGIGGIAGATAVVHLGIAVTMFFSCPLTR